MSTIPWWPTERLSWITIHTNTTMQQYIYMTVHQYDNTTKQQYNITPLSSCAVHCLSTNNIMAVPRGRTPRKKWSCRLPNCTKHAQPKKRLYRTVYYQVSICMGKTIMLLKVSQAFVTIVLIMGRMMFLLLETLVVIITSIIITMMWL